MRDSLQSIVLNGSYGEGGGALLRTALVMSALTQQPVRVHGIRGALRKPGLNAEDLTVLAALASSCRAEVKGDDLDSSDVLFVPTRAPRSLGQQFDVGAYEKGNVPGGAPVVLHSLVPVLCRAGAYSRVTVLGETHGSNTLGYDAFERVNMSVHRAQGVCCFVSHEWAGFGSGTKGEMSMEMEPSVPLGVAWPERGELKRCAAILSYSEVAASTAERGVKRLNELFSERKLVAEVEAIPVRSRGSGVTVTVWAEFERGWGSGTSNGGRGLKIETVVENAFRSFDEWFSTNATVDSFLADQMLILAALAEGKTVYTTPCVTRRLVTMSWVVKQFMPVHITLKGEEGYPGTVTVER